MTLCLPARAYEVGLTPQVGSEISKMDSVGNRVDRLDGVLVTAKLAGMSASERVAKREKRGRVEESNVWT